MLNEIEKLREQVLQDFQNDVREDLLEMKSYTHTEMTKSILQLKQQIQSVQDDMKLKDIREQVKSQFGDMLEPISILPTPVNSTHRLRTSKTSSSQAASTLILSAPTPMPTPTLPPISTPVSTLPKAPPTPRSTPTAPTPTPAPTTSIPHIPSTPAPRPPPPSPLPIPAPSVLSTSTLPTSTPTSKRSLKPKGPLSLCPISPAPNKTMNEIAEIDKQLERKSHPTNIVSIPSRQDSGGDHYMMHDGRRQSQGINLKIVIPIVGVVVAAMAAIMLVSTSFFTYDSTPADPPIQSPVEGYLREWSTELPPVDIVIDSSDTVYTYGDEGVIVTDSSGNFIKSWPSARWQGQIGEMAPGFFKWGWQGGISIDSLDNVYVSDAGNNRIQKFDNEGKFLTMWGSRGESEGQFESPRRIALDSSNNVYVTDAGNNRIQKFDNEGNFITKWEPEVADNGSGLLSGIAIDSSDNVYVAETWSSQSIQKFDSFGDFINKWTYLANDEREDINRNAPIGIAIDSSDNVYVADSENDRIKIFDTDGVLRTSWGSEGTEKGYLNSPQGIDFGSQGNIYVADSWNERVQVFGNKPAP